MSLTFNDSSTLQGLFQDVKFKSGLDALSVADFTRMVNIALEDYAYLAITSSGQWQFDDTTHADADGNYTYNVATATLTTSSTLVLDDTYLAVYRVEIYDGTGWRVVNPVDVRDSADVLSQTYPGSGIPSAYDKTANVLTFYPTNDASRTVRIRVGRSSPHFDTTDTTAPIGIPSIHRKYLIYSVLDQLSERTTIKGVEQKLATEEAKVRDFYSKRDQQTARRMKAKVSVPK